MHCRSCNTRISAGASNCPNCGLTCGAGSATGKDPERSSPGPLSPSTANDAIDLEEIAAPSAASRPKSRAKAKPPKREESTGAGSHGSAGGFGVAPRPAELRALVAENPSLVEAGLSVFQQQGKPVGENFETDLGSIDLLASDSGGGLVVILIAGADAKDIVTEMLGRIGWVGKHVAKPGQEVRGLVLAESMPEGAEYTAAAVADTVSFKTYRISLSFSDLTF